MRLIVLSALLALSACAWETPPPDTARWPLPAGVVNTDPDVEIINQAAWAFAEPSRTRGRPIEAARAAAGVDYLAGQIATSPRWAHVGPLTQLELLQARLEVRKTLGVPATAPSQAVVDALVSTGNALAAGDTAAARAPLHPPVFSLGPEQTLAVLTNLPRLPTANIATAHLSAQIFPDDSEFFHH